MCQFPCERYCEVQLGIALLVHERCHLDGLFDDELLVWSVTLQLQSDIISYLGDLRIWLIPFLGLRLEQLVIEDNPIDSAFANDFQKAQSTVEINYVSEKYLQAWKKELVNAANVLKGKMNCQSKCATSCRNT